MADADLDPANAPALADVLRTVGLELADLGRAASELQAALSPLSLAARRGGADLYRLQALDAVTQALHGVSDFISALAPTVPAHWTCDAARAARVVTLSDLGRRLGRAAPESPQPPGGGAGDLELFDG